MFGRGQTIFSLSDSSSTIRRHEESICKIISNLLVTSSDSASIRKELLVSLKHVLGTDFKRGLFPLVDTLLDERFLVETDRACSESLRPLAYGLLAENVHHVRRDLSLSQGPFEHSKELNDYKNLIKTLVMGMKTIIWSITTTHSPRPQGMNPQALASQSSAPHGLKGMRQDEVWEASGVLRSGDQCLALFKEKDEEEEMLNLFSHILAVMEPQDLMDMFSLCMPELVSNDQLVQMFAAPKILGNLLVSSKLDVLKNPNSDATKVVLHLCRCIFTVFTKPPPDFEGILQHHVPVIMEVCMKNTTMFRGFAGCNYELLPRDLISLLLPCLYILLTMLEGPAREDKKDLCMRLSARLSYLLPYLSRLLKPLVLCLRGSNELVSLGLHPLDFWVETQNPDFLEPSMANVMSKVILALRSHLRPVPYPWGGKDLHILGKLLGGHYGRFLNEPLTLECKDNPEHVLRLVLTILPSTPFLVPLNKFSNLYVAAVIQRNHGVYIYYRKQALKFLPVCLLPQLNFHGGVTDVGQSPMQLSTLLRSSVDSSLCNSEPVEIKADLEVKTRNKLMAEKSIFKTVLTTAACAYSNLSDSESLHVQMIQTMLRCRFLRHVLLFILLPSSWTSLCSADVAEILGFSNEQQQQLYVDRPARRSLLHYSEPIDSLLINDRAGTMFLMDHSGKPRGSASFMFWFLAASFIVVVVVSVFKRVSLRYRGSKKKQRKKHKLKKDGVIKMPDLPDQKAEDRSDQDEVCKASGILRSGDQCLALFKEKDEEKEMLNLFSHILAVMEPQDLMDMFSLCMPELVSNNQLVQMFAAPKILSNLVVGSKRDVLKNPNSDATERVLHLFRCIFGVVTKTPLDFERILQHHVPVIMEVCMKNTTMFRGFAGCNYELLPRDLISMLLPCLCILLTMLEGPAREDKKDLLLELCLRLSARLSYLLPYLSRLLKPLVLCLDFWVETQNPDFLEPSMANVMSKVILALRSHLRPVPYPWGGKDLHNLGKLLGGHYGRFLNEPLALECKDNPEHVLRLVLTILPSTPFLVPLNKFSNLYVAAVIQRNHGVYIYYRKQALKFLPVCLLPQLNFHGGVTDVGQSPMQLSTLLRSSVDSSLCNSEPVEIKADLEVKTRNKLMAEKSIFKTVLTTAACAYSNLSDSESLHVQMIQTMLRCRFLRHVLLFILLPSSWTSLCSADVAEILGFSNEQQQQLYVDRPARRSLLHYPEPIDSLLILDRAGTLFLMDHSGKPRGTASFMVWFLAASFIVVVVVSLCKCVFTRVHKLKKDDDINITDRPEQDARDRPEQDARDRSEQDALNLLTEDAQELLRENADVINRTDQDALNLLTHDAQAPLNEDALEDVPIGEVERLLIFRWDEFLHDKGGKKVKRLFIMEKNIANGKDPSVYEGFLQPRRAVAVKCLSLSQSEVPKVLNEISIHSASDEHPRIIRFYGFEFDQDSAYLVLEPWTCDLHDLVVFSRDKANKVSRSTKAYLERPLDGKVLWKAVGHLSPVVQDLLRDIASGLAHLHELKIVHRDLKPKNVQIIRRGNTLIAKLSNMGNSNHFSDESSSSFSYLGSMGWQAPEQILGIEDKTCAVDMFHFGCIIYFTITGGKHPFGFGATHETNIRNYRFDISLVRDTIPEAHHLISCLLAREPHSRLSASKVLLHPMFWNADMRLLFLREASDRVENHANSTILDALRQKSYDVYGRNPTWENKIGPKFSAYLIKEADSEKTDKVRRAYDFKSMRHLLRLVRNSANHYRELPKDIQALVGTNPEGLDKFFATRFPTLLMEVYNVISLHCKEEAEFIKYF
ncbi:Protein kinase domain [Arabidopsis thaliana x Arabidopsis arenosa]|uniref:Protein kinase domain n=1 Tax=Arabidopsis thaliana x Arabidopsis arenosa TaxID=1240361 RepID=A0A8T2A4K7_9BRAS|nr:Protein kinase domain [Arabidopsis thaliana x Arabidopsis arenosa]